MTLLFLIFIIAAVLAAVNNVNNVPDVRNDADKHGLGSLLTGQVSAGKHSPASFALMFGNYLYEVLSRRQFHGPAQFVV